MKVAVIGGGISGLAAAWELRSEAEVTVFEPGHLGGCITTTPFLGKPVDEGPDAFITRVPEAIALCRELGMDGDLVAPSAGRTLIWWDGRLRPLPDGLVLGVPRDFRALVGSGLLSPLGIGRAGLDIVLPRRRDPEGLTVRELVADRFGAQVADRLVDPLVGGIHAGWTGDLGAAEVVPQLVAAAKKSRSLLLGLSKAAPPTNGPLFLAPRAGMASLVDSLVRALRDAGVAFVEQAVDSVEQTSGREVVLRPGLEVFDACVVATPGAVAADLVGPDGTEALATLPTASVALVTAAFSDVQLPPDVNGILVPREQGKLMTACSFASNKWPHWTAPGRSLVRISTGRYHDDEYLELSDQDLTGRLLAELGEALRTELVPIETRVSRWSGAFPQYLPGHAGRMTGVEDSLNRRAPTVALAGSAYAGSGLPACIASGRRASRRVIERFRLMAA